MNRDELAHILRAAAAITDEPDMLVIGSQAILASYAETQLPQVAIASVEADVAFFGDDAMADLVDGSIGEDSLFHESFGVYAQGVSVSTATLPAGWRGRLVAFAAGDIGRARAVALEPHDLALSKLAAGRPKDFAFVAALVAAQLVDVPLLRSRLELMPVDDEHRGRMSEWLDSVG